MFFMEVPCDEQVKSALRAEKTLHARRAWFEVRLVSRCSMFLMKVPCDEQVKSAPRAGKTLHDLKLLLVQT